MAAKPLFSALQSYGWKSRFNIIIGEENAQQLSKCCHLVALQLYHPYYSLVAPRPEPSGPQVSGGHSNGHPGTRMSMSHIMETTVTDGGFRYYKVTKHRKNKAT